MKISKRLLALSDMVKIPYKVVWDCCCDHGLLGFKILGSGKVEQVNFVDLVPEIMQNLETKLIKFGHHLPIESKWEVFCQDVSSLNLEDENLGSDTNSEPKQLIIISGIGGDLIIEMLESLSLRYSNYNIDYLLCPIQHTYKLRKALVKLNFHLKEEQLVIENDRGYELFLVNQHSGKAITTTGTDFWRPIIEHEKYLSKLIAHYQRILTKVHSDSLLNKKALEDYQNVYQQYFSKTT